MYSLSPVYSAAWVIGHFKVELNDRVEAQIQKKKKFLRFSLQRLFSQETSWCHNPCTTSDSWLMAPTTLKSYFQWESKSKEEKRIVEM